MAGGDLVKTVSKLKCKLQEAASHGYQVGAGSMWRCIGRDSIARKTVRERGFRVCVCVCTRKMA